LNALDLVLSVLLVIGIIRGFMKGFIHEIAVLGTMFICYFFGFKLAESVAVYLNNFFHVDPNTMRIVSIFITWIGISIGIFFLAKLFEGLINITALGLFNKIAGAVFGGFKYAFVISLLLYFLNKFEVNTGWFSSDAKAESFLYYKILKIASTVL
jgi:membrane protein required for colicin V production